MKTLIKGAMLVVLTFLFITETQSQTVVSKLDQVMLIKPLVGTFKCDVAMDTIANWELKPFGKGFELHYTFKSYGETYMDMKDLWGFDLKLNKWVCLSLNTIGNYMIFYAEFKSNNKLFWDGFYMPNSNEILEKYCIEIVNSNKFTVSTIIDGKSSNTLIFYRIEK